MAPIVKSTQTSLYVIATYSRVILDPQAMHTNNKKVLKLVLALLKLLLMSTS